MKTSNSPELKIRQNNKSITFLLLQSKLKSQDAKPFPLNQTRPIKSLSFHHGGNGKKKNDKLPFLEFERKRELSFVTMYVKRKNMEIKERSNHINEDNYHNVNENSPFRKRDFSSDNIDNMHLNIKINENLEKRKFWSIQIENKTSNFSITDAGFDNYKNPFNKTTDYFNEYFPQSNRKSLDTKIFKAIISERKIDKNLDCMQSIEENNLKMQDFFNKTGLGPRQQIEEMKKWFENQEMNIDREKNSDYNEKFNKFFELYDSSLTELILQIKKEFNERGSFLYQIWNKFNKLNSGYKIFLKNNMDDFERKKSEQTNLYLQKYNDIIQNRNGEIEKFKNANAKLILERDALSKKIEDFSNDQNYHNQKISELNNYCQKFQEKYNYMKRSYEKLHKQLMLRSNYYANFKNEELSLADEKKENLNKNDDNPEETKLNNKIIKKKSKIIETNHEIIQINTISADCCSNIQEEEEKKNINLGFLDNTSETPSNSLVQESMKEAIETNFESQNSKKSIQLLSEKKERKIDSLQKLPSFHDNLLEAIKKNISDENLNNPLNNENQSLESSEISEPEKVSEFEIASSQESKSIIKLNDLNNLRRMVNPDKFQASYQDQSSQTEDNLILKKEIETQTPTFLLDRKYDHVFLANSKINEYLQEYLHKKEVESMLSEYNLNEVNAYEKMNKEIRKMVEETLENSNKLIEISHFLISNNENEISEHEHLREQSEIIEENALVSKEQKEIVLPIMKGLINSASLKTKTLQKFREFLLKIMNFYLQESFKNKIFGEEIFKLNSKINEINIECDNIKQENESLKKKLDYLSPIIASQKSGDFQFEDGEGEDNGRSPRKIRSFKNTNNNNNNNTNGMSEFEELKKKVYNPGSQLIAQIKGKNLNNFANMISLKSVFKIILQIYQDRVVLIKENPKIKDIEFSTFVYNFFIKVYGFRKMAQQKFLLFSLTLRKYPTNFRINFFSKFLGLLDPTSANLSLENLNIYISVLESVLNSYQNLDGEQRYMVSATKLWDYFRVSFESKGDSNNPEVLLLKKEFDAIKEDDPKNTVKFGIIDLDVMMSKYLVCLKTIRNKNKICLNMVFSIADLNNDGLCDLNEFELIFKYFEAEQIKENGENPAAGIFESFANQVANNTKSLNFNQFCNICEENNVFDDDKIKEKLKLNDEEENNAKFNKICTEWINKKQLLLGKIEKVLALKNIRTSISWELFIDKIEVKVEKASKTNEYSEKIIATHLLSILENELDLIFKNQKGKF